MDFFVLLYFSYLIHNLSALLAMLILQKVQQNATLWFFFLSIVNKEILQDGVEELSTLIDVLRVLKSKRNSLFLAFTFLTSIAIFLFWMCW